MTNTPNGESSEEEHKFTLLQHDLEKIVKENSQNNEISYSKEEFIAIVNRHRELIRCVKLLDGIYSKSTLFSVATSSVIICASGFNLKVLDDHVLGVPFVAVLIFGMSQVNLHCYYGDYVMRSVCNIFIKITDL
ncbi:unnamed protein product [Arctia plantaginis]|uniref:Uncharacterized protein n=1 Tax=Arctia plantaginis TaxID=874455 RepID=A0A8S0ZUY7_ARCPL|nr:unnamed protein product [Arctia plantaginis]